MDKSLFVLEALGKFVVSVVEAHKEEGRKEVSFDALMLILKALGDTEDVLLEIAHIKIAAAIKEVSVN